MGSIILLTERRSMALAARTVAPVSGAILFLPLAPPILLRLVRQWRNSSGSLAIFAAILRGSSLLSSFAVSRCGF
jgi:hypothetical protein